MGLDPITQDIHALFRILFAFLDCEIFEYFLKFMVNIYNLFLNYVK
jgi:hypothetical protein